MTKNDFFKGLDISLGFLNESERDQIKAYYLKELSGIPEDMDISDHVRVMDLPASITERIKNPNTVEEKKEEVFDDDLIFSRPLIKEKAPEVIHSMENREIKTLYGERVVIENRKEPIEEITIEPIDQANGLTDEEILEAKASTLEKAEKYVNQEEKPLQEEEHPAVKEPIMIEEEEEDLPEPVSEEPIHNTPGVFENLWAKMNITGSGASFLTVLLSVLLSPVLLSALVIGLGIYALLITVILATSVLLILVMALFIGIGVVELIYGILSLFQNIPVALVELGFGTVLFSIVTCFGALIYQFLFGVAPKAFQRITKFFTDKIHKIRVKLYGGAV